MRKSLILIACALLLATCTGAAEIQSSAKGIVFLGDSTFDIGTNKYLKHSISNCSYAPYHEDRCSNGDIIPDVLSKELGLPRPRPYLEVRYEEDLPLSLDMASAGAGILPETRKEWGVVSFVEQVQQLEEISHRIPQHQIKDWLVIISIGSNDLFINLSSTHREEMKFTLTESLTKMYSQGFRKVLLSTVGPLGSLPLFKDYYLLHGMFNGVVKRYNSDVETVVHMLAKQYPDFMLTIGDTYKRMVEMLAHPRLYGFMEGRHECCPHCSPIKGGPISHAERGVCDNPHKYLFWDAVHLSEHSYQVMATDLLYGSTEYARPYNIMQLVESTPASTYAPSPSLSPRRFGYAPAPAPTPTPPPVPALAPAPTPTPPPVPALAPAPSQSGAAGLYSPSFLLFGLSLLLFI